MTEVAFDQISERSLLGHWRVESCVRPPRLPDCKETALLMATFHTYLPGGKCWISHPHPIEGQWELDHEVEILNRPYIRYRFPHLRSEALILRLQALPDQSRAQLTLYFADGTELLLVKEDPFLK